MFKLKRKYIGSIQEIIKICKEMDVSDKMISDLDILSNEIQEFKIKVPLIGCFNAGKSTILNSYLGKEYLPTDIRPETAIATEILYSDKNEIIAFEENGNKTTFSKNEIKKIDPNKYHYIQLLINSDALKNNNDIVLVDMPGLDSGLKSHNKAILRYIEKGVKYIVIVDAEDGSIKGSTMNFLTEINQYDQGYSILINKIDKKPQEDIELIKNSVAQMVGVNSNSPMVGTVSAISDEIDAFNTVINSIDKKECLNSTYQDKIKEKIKSIIQDLNIRVNTINTDSSVINASIEELKKSAKKLETSLAEEENKLEQRFSSSVVEDILRKTKQELKKNSTTLVRAMQTSQTAFQQEVNEIMRPALILATNENIQIEFNETLQNFNQSFNRSVGTLDKILSFESNHAKELSDSLISGVEDVSAKLIHAGSKISTVGKIGSSVNASYKGIAATLGITTSIVAPWLEIAILFLPEIISLFSKFFRNESSQIETMRQKIEFEVIPQIASNLRPQIKEGLDKAKITFINDLKIDMEQKQVRIFESLEKAQQTKKNNEQEIAEKSTKIKEAITKLINLAETM